MPVRKEKLCSSKEEASLTNSQNSDEENFNPEMKFGQLLSIKTEEEEILENSEITRTKRYNLRNDVRSLTPATNSRSNKTLEKALPAEGNVLLPNVMHQKFIYPSIDENHGNLDCASENSGQEASQNRDSILASNDSAIAVKELSYSFHKCSVKLQKLRTFQCQHCSKHYAFQQQLSKHISENHLLRDEKPIQSQRRYTCNVCSESFDMRTTMYNHMLMHARDKSSPTLEQQTSPNINQSKILSPKVDLDELYAKVRTYTCLVCLKFFTGIRDFKLHMKSHVDDKSFLCEICLQAFSGRTVFDKHMKTHTGSRPYTCFICFKSYPTSATLKVHMRIHAPEKPFLCKFCSKTFPLKGQLQLHLTVHTGEKPYTCDVCLKSYSRKSTLMNHVRLHSENRPYVCQICSKKFKQSGNLATHMKIHTNERIPCSFCPKLFIQKVHLDRHMRIHTGERPYSCNTCHQSFRQSSHCKIHFSRMHN